jgi:divalent metal cation (Fe/Co/Zn/Cd) transporter
MLFGLQLTAAILSGSLALFAATADSFMDVCSNFVMFLTTWIQSQQNYLLYPTGKSRYETAGIIVFSTLMSTLSIQIVIAAIQSFVTGGSRTEFTPLILACVGIAIGI